MSSPLHLVDRFGEELVDRFGEVLRHRAPNTTEIYAKVDLDGLRALARPWPTREVCDE